MGKYDKIIVREGRTVAERSGKEDSKRRNRGRVKIGR